MGLLTMSALCSVLRLILSRCAHRRDLALRFRAVRPAYREFGEGRRAEFLASLFLAIGFTGNSPAFAGTYVLATTSNLDKCQQSRAADRELINCAHWFGAATLHRYASRNVSTEFQTILAYSGVDQERLTLQRLLQNAHGDFDRFINGLLHRPEADLEAFKFTSNVAGILDGFFVKNGFETLTRHADKPATPFHPFAAFRAAQSPSLLRGKAVSSLDGSKAVLVKADEVNAKKLYCSILLSDGKVTSRSCFRSIVVGGGDVTITDEIAGSIVICAGDVTLGGIGGHSAQTLIIAGGTVTICNIATGLMIVTPISLVQ